MHASTWGGNDNQIILISPEILPLSVQFPNAASQVVTLPLWNPLFGIYTFSLRWVPNLSTVAEWINSKMLWESLASFSGSQPLSHSLQQRLGSSYEGEGAWVSSLVLTWLSFLWWRGHRVWRHGWGHLSWWRTLFLGQVPALRRDQPGWGC